MDGEPTHIPIEEEGADDSPEEESVDPQEETPGVPSIELAKANTGLLSRRSASVKKIADNEAEGWLTVDVYETPSDIVVESAIAGVSPEDIDITATSDSVTIKGERKRNREAKVDDYLYQECYWGRFSRSIVLPQEIDPEAASVGFKNGILTIRLPKVKRHKGKKLSVSAE